MSMHHVEHSPELAAALSAHSLRVDGPSQLSDAFRLGWLAAVAAERERCARICERIEAAKWAGWKQRGDMLDHGASDGAAECAAAIRSEAQ